VTTITVEARLRPGGRWHTAKEVERTDTTVRVLLSGRFHTLPLDCVRPKKRPSHYQEG